VPQRVVTFVGTRPEVIKLAPVIGALDARPHLFEQTVVATGQHREMLEQTLAAFGVEPDVNLELMQPDQRLDEFAARALTSVGALLDELQPEVALVQGDTTTVMMTSLAAFYRGIPLGHVEAGLRSHSPRSPFPEELNRRVAALAATHHFAPTPRARENLLREGVSAESIHVTGNTVVDALLTLRLPDAFADPRLREIDFDNGCRTVLVTAHRRESHGEPLQRIFRSLRTLVDRFDDVQFVFPVHLNPRVRRDAYAELDGAPRVHLVEPLPYPELMLALSRSDFVMTDSGGIQEEAPSWRKPVLVLREVTERPELIEAGMGELVGTETDAVVAAASRLLTDGDEMRAMCSGENPFGDGRSGERIADILEAANR
jgi:UDP-N-acetylglucosamine 2-epimerase (non-hydrolysing)